MSNESRTAMARAARIDMRQARYLPSPAERMRRMFFWMYHFSITTKNILIHLGLTHNQISQLSKDGILEHQTRSWRPTSRSESTQVTCWRLTAKGQKQMREHMQQPWEDRHYVHPQPPTDSELSHDLQLQAFLVQLYARDQIKSMVGPALIRHGFLKRDLTQLDFPPLFRGQAWQFDALIRSQEMINGQLIEAQYAIELERSKKKSIKDKQRFFDKLSSVRRGPWRVVILAETESAAQDWRSELNVWRDIGRPLEQKKQGKAHDEHSMLNDLGRTMAVSCDAGELAALVTGPKRPSGSSGPSTSGHVSIANLIRLDAEARQVDEEWRARGMRERMNELLAGLADPGLNSHSRPVSVQDWEVWPDQMVFFSPEEIERLADRSVQIDNSKWLMILRARQQAIRAWLKPPSPVPPAPAPADKPSVLDYFMPRKKKNR